MKKLLSYFITLILLHLVTCPPPNEDGYCYLKRYVQTILCESVKFRLIDNYCPICIMENI